jgi:predicted dehydrogenase
MSKSNLGIGFVGAGANTRLRHLPGFQEIEKVALVAVCNRSESSSQAVAKDFGISRVYRHWEEVVHDPQVDAVCIGTWPNLHAEVTCAALEAGKHVLTEARMAANLSEARTMLEASRQRPDLVAQIVPAPMSLELDATIRQWIVEERLGDLLEVKTFMNLPLHLDPETPRSWRLDPAKSGHNMMALGIYYEMLQRWLGCEASWVQADAQIFTPQRVDAASGQPAKVGLPESLLVAGRYAPPSPPAPPIRLQMEFSGVDTCQRQGAVLNGRRGSLAIDFSNNALHFFPTGAPEAPEEVPIAPETRRGWQVEADFINSIRQQKPVQLTSFEQGLRYMLFTDAVYRSWKNAGLRIPVDPVF